MTTWDPTTYLRYGDERARPFLDLVARIDADRPRAVVDLGCGPGNLTATLAARWPNARVEGIDSAPEMVDRARREVPGVDFGLGDVRDWRPAPDVDVLVSNAALQWVPGHEELLTRWAGELPAGAVIAVQVPGNFGAPSHRALRELAAEPAWAPLAGLLRESPVSDAAGYATLLTAAGCAVDAWETTYVHLLPAEPGADHPVLRWMDGTALRPVRAALDDEAFAAFRRQLAVRLEAAYPARDSLVYFPFHRIFVVARTGVGG
ncbi:trans-aconitate 2-methyltransferase [Polymorphospora sp. NPDC050346]|uniref:trans-aconitate 2-methyltransferase n=1 Tax=Polymorphospora sp. NPDC050346 TaxID=3155780 RepID=UPI0033FDDC2A